MIFWKLASSSIRSQMQYPASFAMLAIGHFFSSLIEIAVIWALFDRFRMVKGWTLYEVGLIYGIVHMGFAFAECFARGFDQFSLMVRSGDFDRLLLRPYSPLLQIAARDIQLMRVGRFVQGTIVLAVSAYQLSFSLVSLHALVIFFALLGTASVFYGLFILQATLSFWTIETLELMNITTYGGVQTGQYPASIYPKPLRLVFTLLVPLACVAYYPIAILLRHENLPIGLSLLFPLAGILFLLLACRCWRFGVNRYCSTGN